MAMNNKIIKYAIISFLLIFIPARETYADSIFLSLDSFLFQVKTYHPQAANAQLILKQARSAVKVARGAFDPTLGLNLQEKRYDDKTYYRYFEPQVKMATRLGVELKTGYELNNGPFINPETGTTPSQGLWYAGLSVPLLRGLLIDERRAAFQQALQEVNLSTQDRNLIINKLLFDASKAYWDWYKAEFSLAFYENGYNLALQRLEFVKQQVNFGESQAIDTVEAQIEVGVRYAQVLDSRLETQNARLYLSSFLWGEDFEPLVLSDSTYPKFPNDLLFVLNTDSLNQLFSFAVNNHPDLLMTGFKINQLEIERKLWTQSLLPQVDINYYPLLEVPFNSNNFNQNYFSNNYKYGIGVYMPLFLRKERGKLEMTRFKLNEQENNFANKQRKISVEFNQSRNQLINAYEQLQNQERLTNNNQILRDGEEIKLINGESTLFLINQRERSLISAQVKLVEIQSKLAKSYAELFFYAGKNLVDR